MANDTAETSVFIKQALYIEPPPPIDDPIYTLCQSTFMLIQTMANMT